MRSNRWLAGGLVLFVVLAVAASLYTGGQRYVLEKQHRGMEIAIVYDELAGLAGIAGWDSPGAGRALGGVLDEFKTEVTTVLFKEDTPATLQARGEFVVGSGQEMLLWRPDLFSAAQVNPGDTFLLTTNKDYWLRVAKNMHAKGFSMSAGEAGPGHYVISTPLSSERLGQWGLGFPIELMDQVSAAGFNVLVQLRTWPEVNQYEIEGVFEPLHEIPNLSGVLFNDEQLPGFGYKKSQNTLFGAIGQEIEKLGVPLVQIEFTTQRGFTNVAHLLDKRVVRLHTITQGEMDKYTPARALDRYLLAASDRNMRILLVRFFSGVEYPDHLQTNSSFLKDLKTALEKEGFMLGGASQFKPLAVSGWAVAVTGLGVAAGGVLLLLRLFPHRRAPVIIGAAWMAAWLAVVGLGSFLNPGLMVTGRKMMALAAVIIFPALAILSCVQEKGLPPGRAVARLLSVSLLSLTGAVLMVGLLADVGFMLGLDRFAGVKLAHVIPLILIAGYFLLTVPRGEHWVGRIIRTAQNPVTIGLAAISGLLGIVLLVYVLRTGNTDVGAVLPLEQQFRTFLENTLVVRPRTKEFLFGHPLLLLLLFTGYRDVRYLPLLLLGAIGQVSMVNTFAHIHTPLVISLWRCFNGLWLGILMGLLFIGLWRVSRRVWANRAGNLLE